VLEASTGRTDKETETDI